MLYSRNYTFDIKSGFESLVRQGLAIQAYYTMPPVLAIVLLAFSILALFSNMSWILTTTIKKPSDFYYQNLFVLGQIKSKMASSAKTMGVISCILILSIVLMAWLPVNAIRASEYQKITSPLMFRFLQLIQLHPWRSCQKPL